MLGTDLGKILLVVVPVAVGGCAGGFVVQDPPENQIMFIRNTGDIASRADTGQFQPYPLPVLPAARVSELRARPYVLHPKEVPGAGPAALALPNAVGVATPADVNVSPFDAYARLTFFKAPQDPRWCTAEFVGNSRDVLLTAGHCVYDENTWHNGWRAYSKFSAGAYAQQYNWDCVAVYSGWARRGFWADYAFIKVSGNAQTALGLRGAALPSALKSVGYPGNYFSGQQLVQVDGTLGTASGGIVQMQSNPFGGGSSGGAWLDGSVAISLNSFKYDTDANSMFGPQFDATAIALYEFVRNGCRSDEVPAGISSDQTAAKPVVATAASRSVTIKNESTKECTCQQSKMATLSNDTPYRYIVRLRTVLFGPTPADWRNELLDTEILAGERRPLGCTAAANAQNQCVEKAIHSIVQANKIHRIAEKTGLTKLQSVSPDFCASMCVEGAPTGYCLGLGTSASAIIASLESFVSTTLDKPSTGDVVATIGDMVRAFKGDPQKVGNPCQRGSFFRRGDVVSNDGIDCRVTTEPLGTSPQALRITLATPTQTRANRVQSNSTNPSLAIFSDQAQSPTLHFAGPANEDEYNALFGGAVTAVQRINSRVIVTTENGCVAGDR